MTAREPDKGGRIEISVPTTHSEVDDSVWDELEVYLFNGFLTSHSIINNQTFVFKTVNHHEYKLINFMRPFADPNDEKRNFFRAAFISYSVFMINGTNVLIDREKNITKLIKVIGKLPVISQEKIFKNISILNEKVARLYPLVEAYANENKSRFKWYSIKGNSVNCAAVTGIPGTDILGLNNAQILWTVLNKIQDLKDESEKDWSNAKFVGSCMAGKGIKSIDEKDKMRHEREKADRQDLKFRVLREYLNRSTGEEKKPVEMINLPDGRQAEVVSRHRADSAEDLAKQLSAALNNEKDAHDLAVEAHFIKYSARLKEIEKERKKLISSVSLNPEKPDGGSSIISKDEAESRINRLREMMLNADKQIIPDLKASNSDKS